MEWQRSTRTIRRLSSVMWVLTKNCNRATFDWIDIADRKIQTITGSPQKIGVYALATLLLLVTFLKGIVPPQSRNIRLRLHRQHLIRDARNYASAELFRLTGNNRWNKIFVATTQLNKPNPELLLWQKHDQSEAAWVYAQINRAGVDTAVQARCKRSHYHSGQRTIKHHSAYCLPME